MSRRTTISTLLTTKPAPRSTPAGAEPLSTDNDGMQPAPATASAMPGAAEHARTRNSTMRAMESSLSGLAARVENGSVIVELDPVLIDSSFISDRLATEDDPTFAALVESMRESGQQVPVLVRRHPEKVGRFQVAYGHRRVRAAVAMGRTVRAVVKALSDAELVVAQGKENLERRDLSYIERALFALRLERHGFPREVIGAALGEHKPNLSVLIGVARSVPEELLAAIGPAPRAGRPRWQMLADLIKAAPKTQLKRAVVETQSSEKSSDDRFLAVLDLFAATPPLTQDPKKIWKDEDGREIVRIARSKGRIGLEFDDSLEPGLADYLLVKLPDILANYKSEGKKRTE